MNRNEEQLEKYFIEQLQKLGWKYIHGSKLPRTGTEEPLIISDLLEAIKRLNKHKKISEDDIQRTLNELKLIVTGVNGAKKILEYYKNGIPIKYEVDKVVKYTDLFNYVRPGDNNFVISNQVYNKGAGSIINDLILYINGIPLVNIELKDPTNPAESWQNAYYQIKGYEMSVPELYKYVQIGVAAEAFAKYFPIVPWEENTKTYNWRISVKEDEPEPDEIDSIIRMLKPETLLEIINSFLFVRTERSQDSKVIVRYMQYEAVNKIYNRVKNNYDGLSDKNKGLIWHWQGSGKTLEIIFAANKLFLYDALGTPSIYIIIDRDDLQTQLSDDYNALDIKKPHIIESIRELKENISSDSYKGKRGIFIVLIHKFNPSEFFQLVDEVNKQTGETIKDRKNIICFIDEGHRTQAGLYAAQMRDIFKSAFFFAFTGTPVVRKGFNTYSEFCYPPEEPYLDKYFISQSIKDGYTKRIVHEPRLDELHLSKDHLEDFLNVELEEIPEEYRDDVKEEVRSKLNKINAFLEMKSRIITISEDISKDFLENLDGRYKALIVAGSRLACIRYKSSIDNFLPKEYSEVIISFNRKTDRAPERKEIYDYITELEKRNHNKDYEDIRKEAINNFKDEDLPKILIVTDMLLTGFDAPILQTMYLDKPLKEQRLLQAIARTNRPYKEKEAGLIIDYVGIFDRIEKAFEIYEREDIINTVIDKDKLTSEYESRIKKLGEIFEGVKRDYDKETLTKTITILTSEKAKEIEFVNIYKETRRIYELLGSHAVKIEYLTEYKWLTAVYTYYLKIVVKDEEYENYVRDYYKKTIEMIHKETEVEKIYRLPLQNSIDEDFVKRISEDAASKEYKASNFVFALNKFILVDQHKNPMYESLIEKVEKLVKEWRDRIKKNENVSKQLEKAEQIINEIEEVKKKKDEFNLSDEEMAAWLILKNQLGIDGNDEELIGQLKELFEELDQKRIPGWAKNTELKKSIETKLREFLFVNVRTKYPMDLEKLNSIHKNIGEQLTGYEGRK
ncbi:MAG: HsdR family type I site-specific deoxyribonuclease [Bacteroidetes bacterium]|nr:HsdR family type I site-specific deoxyribonuclease [Bacteroidota bacterium]